MSNAERHLKPAAVMARLFRDHPGGIARTLEIVERCRFSLDALAYEYPDQPVPEGTTPDKHLATLAWKGAAHRYPAGVPEKVRTNIAKELALIMQLGYARYFLAVRDIVRHVREKGILCQGRGSAANSVVCFCLGITAVDPTEIDLCPNASSPPNGASRRISMSISNTSGARRRSSTSTTATTATAPASPRP